MLPLAIRCLENQLEAVLSDREILRKLFVAVDWSNDLRLYTWAQWYALTLEFRPDLILELGRGNGNSTCLFTQAAVRIKGLRVKSFDLAREWTRRSQVATCVPEGWFNALECVGGDMTAIDFAPIVKGAERVLILWDAHGYEVAEHVLGHILPLVADRPNMVLCHDISDNRVCHVERDYQGLSIWRGMKDYYRHEGKRSRVNLFWGFIYLTPSEICVKVVSDEGSQRCQASQQSAHFS